LISTNNEVKIAKSDLLVVNALVAAPEKVTPFLF